MSSLVTYFGRDVQHIRRYVVIRKGLIAYLCRVQRSKIDRTEFEHVDNSTAIYLEAIDGQEIEGIESNENISNVSLNNEQGERSAIERSPLILHRFVLADNAFPNR